MRASLPIPVAGVFAVALGASAGCGRIDYELLLSAAADDAGSMAPDTAAAYDGNPTVADSSVADVMVRDSTLADGGPGALDGAPPDGFGSPTQLLDEVDAPWVMTDGLVLYFQSTRAGGMGGSDLYVATRALATEAWGPAQSLVGVNTASNENQPCVSEDGGTLWFSSDRPGGEGLWDIWVAQRQGDLSQWSVLGPDAELSWPTDDLGPTVIASGLRIVFYRQGGGAAARDLFEATRASVDDPWGEPQPIAELNTSAQETNPHLTDDGLTILFASDRPGGMGDRDLYMAVRADLGTPFGAPVALEALNSPSWEDDPWLSDDLRTLYFTSLRDGPVRTYVAER